MTRVPLRAYGLTRRKPRLDVGGGTVTFVLPSWFGDHAFSTPAGNVVVADASPPASLALPYLGTHGATPANLALVFREPVPVPPFGDEDRELPPEARAGYLDGMRLLATDPRAAAEALAAAGAHRVDDLGAWLGEHRPHLAEAAAAALPPHPLEPWLERVAGALFLVALVGAVGGRLVESMTLAIVSMPAGIAAAFLLTAAPRLLRRRAAARRRRPGAGPGA